MKNIIDDDVLTAYEEYKADGREFYNPFTKKAIYKNRKNWVLWITRNIGKCKTNQFLFLFEQPHYSRISGEKLGLESFNYNRNTHARWASATPEEIARHDYVSIARKRISDIKREDKINLSYDECATQLSTFFDGETYHIPLKDRKYNSRQIWKDKMGYIYDRQTIHTLCFLMEPPVYSKLSGVKLTLNDYHYIRGFNGFTKDETDNHGWMQIRDYHITDENRLKMSETLKTYYASDKGLNTRQKMSESRKIFNKTEYGIALKLKQRAFQSETMKRKIADGSFTPNITNSWTNWEAIIEIEDGTIKKFRSSWEACFWFCNQHLQFENIRVPCNNRCYIIDFYDDVQNIIYELKPKSRYNIEIDKMTALINYCAENSITFKWINEHNILEYIREKDFSKNESAKKQYDKLLKGVTALKI